MYLERGNDVSQLPQRRATPLSGPNTIDIALPPLFLRSLSMDPPLFDSRAFLKYMKAYGKAYRHRSLTLIRICRLFSRSLNEFPGQYYRLQE